MVVEFVPLQDMFNKNAETYEAGNNVYDGVHLHIAGAKLIASE